MNMKKTIAGVMAGAMAVSAMATMVSADQDSIVLDYDLKTYKDVKNNTSGEVTYLINFVNGSSDYGFMIDKDKNGDFENTKVTFGVQGGVFSKYYANGKEMVNPTLKDVEASFTSLKNLKSDTGATTVTAKWYNKNKVDQVADQSTYALNGYTAYDMGWGGDTTFTIELDPNSAQTGAVTGNKMVVSGFNNATLGQTANSAYDFSFQSGYVKLTFIVNTVMADQTKGNYDSIWDLLYPGEISKLEDVSLKASDFINTNVVVKGVDGLAQPLAISAFKEAENKEVVFPMKSDLAKPADVVAALQTRKQGGAHYTNPVAVINDAIANNENVVFKFTSYPGKVITSRTKIVVGDWVGELGQEAPDWMANTWSNPTFGQHLYNSNTYGDYQYSEIGQGTYDMYGSYSSAWAQNLFTGAITVNSGLTMQLSDTDVFTWGENSLSFDWFTITDDGKYTEAKTFLTKMLLYTPVEWYWDRLIVTVGNTEDGEDVVPGEGAEGDGDVISDDDGDELIIDPIEDVEPVVEETDPVVTDAPAVTEAVTPVAPVESPKTGNAPVALAVIPVALAAAAVVAKKRG